MSRVTDRPLSDTPPGHRHAPGGPQPQAVAVDPAALQSAVAATLPAYMVPSAIVVLEAWPLTANGKLDRRALPAPVPRGARAWRAPRTPEEEVLCGVLADLLGVERVGLDDDFFALGGHSLLATRLVSRLRATLGVEVPVRTVFETPQVAALASRLREGGAARPALVAAPRPARVPLSYAQQRLWFLDQLNSGSTEYHLVVAQRLRGLLDRAALQQALDTIVARHESLRTHFPDDAEGPVQVITPAAPTPLPVIDLDGLAAASQETAIREVVQAERAAPLPLGTGPLVRLRLLVIGPDEHVLIQTVHHIVSDGWSHRIFQRELWALYAAYRAGQPNPLRPLAVQYADFALWQRAWLEEGALASGLTYWTAQLAGLPDRLELPTDRPRPPVQTFVAERCHVTLAADELLALKRLSDTHGATLFMTLLTAFAVVLARYSGQDDVVVGTPIANRQDAQLEDVIGLFVNLLPVRVRLAPSLTFLQLLAQVRQTTLDAYQHQDVPFERIVEALALPRSLNTSPIFQVAFAMQHAARSASDAHRLGVESLDTGVQQVRYDLEVYVWESDRELRLSWLYNRDIFDQSFIQQLVGHYQRFLSFVVDHADEVLGRFDMVDGGDRRALVHASSGTVATIDAPTAIALFEEQVEAAADAIALVSDEQSLSYAELNERANRLAHVLIRQGIGPEDLVALALPRSPALIVALLGVWKAGAAYLPLDLDYPMQRLAFMLNDAKPMCALALRETVDQLPGGSTRLALDDPDLIEMLERSPRDNPTNDERVRALRPEHPAYVIYTSGSTGQPKGTIIAHGGLPNVAAAQKTFGAVGGSRVLQVASISFDISVWEMMMAFTSGATLVQVRGASAGPLLAEAVAKYAITHATLVPVVLATIADTHLPIETLIAGGEYCSGDTVARWQPGRRMFNAYGPTEVTIAATISAPVSGRTAPPIGTPICNTRIYVLDDNLQFTPAGVAGEMYVAGVGLARGYLRRAGLTAHRFVANPFDAGNRMYRTGDRARWRRGELEFIGQTDRQVKVRGYRIELGEIETALREHPGIRDAAVVVQDVSGRLQLVAYVATDDVTVDLDALRQSLARTLPHYMVPDTTFALSALPLNINGKLDRSALPVPDASALPSSDPLTPAERVLCRIAAEILHIDTVGPADNFFARGGDSIMSIQLVSDARRMGIHVKARDVFLQPNLRALAAVARVTIDIESSGVDALGSVALTPIVRWLEQQGGSVQGFCQSRMLDVPEGLDESAIVGALDTVTDHHDALRSRLSTREGSGGWTLDIPPHAGPAVAERYRRVSIAGLSDDDRLGAIDEAAHAAVRRLDPESGVLVQVVWFDAGSDAHGRLLLVIHHLAVDAVSWRILIPDFERAYQAARLGHPPPFSGKTTSFRQWADRVQQDAQSELTVQELTFWHSTLLDAEQIAAPGRVDTQRDPLAAARRLTVTVPPDVTAMILTTLPTRLRVGVNDVLVAALALAIAACRRSDGTSDSTVVIDLEGHGREHLADGIDVSETVGWFTTLYPIRLDLTGFDIAAAASGGPTLWRAVKSIKEQLRNVPRNGIGYGMLRYLNPMTAPSLAAMATPRIGFNYLGQTRLPDGQAWPICREPGLSLSDPSGPIAHGLDVNVAARDAPNGLRLHAAFRWTPSSFADSEIEAVAEWWLRMLTLFATSTEALGSGGRTPSDVPLVSLTQDEIEQLEARHGELEDILPLSPLQEGLLFHGLYEAGGEDVYMVQTVLTLEGPTKVGSIHSALEALLHSHGNLRAAFVHTGLTEPVQVIPRRATLPWTEIHLSDVDRSEVEANFTAWLSADRGQRFDIECPPLFRATAFVMGPAEVRLVLTFHHILLDGWSLPLIIRELEGLYVQEQERGESDSAATFV